MLQFATCVVVNDAKTPNSKCDWPAMEEQEPSSSTSDYFSYRPSKYKDWTEEQMRAVYEDGTSI